MSTSPKPLPTLGSADSSKRIKVLLIDDDPDIAFAMQQALSVDAGAGPPFELETADRISTGLERLDRGGIDLLLLDLGLPDASGFQTFLKVHAYAQRLPIVVLSGVDDEALAVQAVQDGAQDYLVKGQVDRNLLLRALRYALQRHELQEQLRSLSLTDELTGLNNRRGFMTLAAQQLKLADRTKRGLLLLFADLDHMKQINDTLGHPEGDRVLTEAAGVLRETFRGSDIVARVGGDEFVVLAIEYAPASDELVRNRLLKNLELANAKRARPFPLALSIGTAGYDPNQPCSLEELMARADSAMYAHKRTSSS